MIAFLGAALAAVAAVAVELMLPGKAVYHAGWYNVALIALVVIALTAGRKAFVRVRSARRRWATAAVVFGAAVAGLAGAASGLLAPDNQTFVGAPGERIRVESLGVLAFPLATAGTPTGSVSLERPLRAQIQIGARRRNAGNFILRAFERDVAVVEARDLRGNRLTVTQPSGSVFLSPVLLMEHRQTIAGMDLPYDSFTVPSARRVVKAVLFTPTQAAMLAHGAAPDGDAAILFAVDDEKERPLPHAIAISFGGKAVRAGDLLLRGAVAEYPAVEVVAAPNAVATGLGVLLVVGGLLASVARRRLLAGDDRPNVAQHDAAVGELDASRG